MSTRNVKILDQYVAKGKVFISIPHRKDIVINKTIKGKKISIDNLKNLNTLEGRVEIENEINSAYINKRPLKVSIVKAINGGWSIDYKGIKMFLPISQFIFKINALSFKKYPLYIFTKLPYRNTTSYVLSKSPYGKDDNYATDSIKSIFKEGCEIIMNTSCIFCNSVVIYKCFKEDTKGYVGYSSVKDNLTSYYVVKELPNQIIGQIRKADFQTNSSNKNFVRVRLNGGYIFSKLSKLNFCSNLYSAAYTKKSTHVRIMSKNFAIEASKINIANEEYVKFIKCNNIVVTNNKKYIFHTRCLNRYEFTTIAKNGCFKLTNGKLVIPTPETKFKILNDRIYLLSYFDAIKKRFVYKKIK